MCFEDRVAIDAEFTAAGLPAPEWSEIEVLGVTPATASAMPWDSAEQDRMLRWLAVAANQFVNSFRPRLRSRYS